MNRVFLEVQEHAALHPIELWPCCGADDYTDCGWMLDNPMSFCEDCWERLMRENSCKVST